MNHSEMHVNGQIHLNGLENFWSLIKRGLGRTYVSVEPFHLSGMWTSKGFATTIANMRRIEDQRRGTVQQSVRSDCRSSVELQAISREGGAEARGSFLGKRRGVKVGGNVGLLRFWAAFIATPRAFCALQYASESSARGTPSTLPTRESKRSKASGPSTMSFFASSFMLL
jgi:hypothetical protein